MRVFEFPVCFNFSFEVLYVAVNIFGVFKVDLKLKG
jgi:hypothetical protein